MGKTQNDEIIRETLVKILKKLHFAEHFVGMTK